MEFPSTLVKILISVSCRQCPSFVLWAASTYISKHTESLISLWKSNLSLYLPFLPTTPHFGRSGWYGKTIDGLVLCLCMGVYVLYVSICPQNLKFLSTAELKCENISGQFSIIALWNVRVVWCRNRWRVNKKAFHRMKMLKAGIAPELLYHITLDARQSDYCCAVAFLGWKLGCY